jgi:hypothetical protein
VQPYAAGGAATATDIERRAGRTTHVRRPCSLGWNASTWWEFQPLNPGTHRNSLVLGEVGHAFPTGTVDLSTTGLGSGLQHK